MRPPAIYRRRTTGRFRIRCGWLRRPILQVEIAVERLNPWPRPDGGPRQVLSSSNEWRDATMDDMLQQEFTMVSV